MSLAIDTIVAIPNNKTVAIQDIAIGDKVETYNYSTQSGLSKGNPLIVKMSDGTGNTPISQNMINISFGNSSSLICSPDQKILTENGKLKTAKHFMPNDNIFLADGSTTKIVMVVMGTYQEGIHMISTSLNPTTSLQHGNLFCANGIIVADYALNLGEPDNDELRGLNPE